MPIIENPTFDQYDSILAYLGGSNYRWNAENDLGTNVIITYSFPQDADLPTGTGYYGVDGFEGFTEAQQTGFRTVLDQVEAFAGVRFVEVESDAMIDGMIGLNGEGVSGYASYPNVYGDFTGESDLVMVYTAFEEPGSFTYYVAMHELGHALGLEHTHEGEHTPDEGDDIPQNSVMTYNYSPIPEVYGTFDIAALQHLYGDSSNSAGWDVSVLGNGRVQTVGGTGHDTMLGVSGQNMIQAGWGHDTVMGRASDDLLMGQNGKDILIGNAGADQLRGGNGNDILDGGAGTDRLFGGSGSDTFVFRGGEGAIRDRVIDFTFGEDKLMLQDTGLVWDNLDIFATGDGQHLIVKFTEDFRVVLVNQGDITLTADDIIFAENDLLG